MLDGPFLMPSFSIILYRKTLLPFLYQPVPGTLWACSRPDKNFVVKHSQAVAKTGIYDVSRWRVFSLSRTIFFIDYLSQSYTVLLKKLLPYLCLLFCMPLYAQRYQISLKSWTSQDGISDRQVNGVYKDSRGFIWLCTRNGLDRFDGYRFTNYTKEKDHFPFTYLAKMTEDAAGNFWILGNAGIDSNNLFIFDPLRKKVRSLMQVTGYRTGFRFNFLEKFNDSTLFFGRMKDTVFFTWHPRTGLQRIRYPVAVNAGTIHAGCKTIHRNYVKLICRVGCCGRYPQ